MEITVSTNPAELQEQDILKAIDLIEELPIPATVALHLVRCLKATRNALPKAEPRVRKKAERAEGVHEE